MIFAQITKLWWLTKIFLQIYINFCIIALLIKKETAVNNKMALLSMNSNEKDKQNEFKSEAIPQMNALYSFARHLTGNSDDADDLLQDTYLKAFRFWDKYQKGTNIRAWLFRIMKNSYINRYRKVTKEPELIDFDEIQEYYTRLQDTASNDQDLAKKMFGGLFDDEVAKALDELLPDFKTVVILCDIEGYTYEEIAEFIDIPIGTVRSRLHRGRKMLQSKLFEYAKKKGIVK